MKTPIAAPISLRYARDSKGRRPPDCREGEGKGNKEVFGELMLVFGIPVLTGIVVFLINSRI